LVYERKFVYFFVTVLNSTK